MYCCHHQLPMPLAPKTLTLTTAPLAPPPTFPLPAHIYKLQERRIAELESQLAESQQQLEAAQSNRTVTQEALDQVSAPCCTTSTCWKWQRIHVHAVGCMGGPKPPTSRCTCEPASDHGGKHCEPSTPNPVRQTACAHTSMPVTAPVCPERLHSCVHICRHAHQHAPHVCASLKPLHPCAHTKQAQNKHHTFARALNAYNPVCTSAGTHAVQAQDGGCCKGGGRALSTSGTSQRVGFLPVLCQQCLLVGLLRVSNP
jgi:hypothetical protein